MFVGEAVVSSFLAVVIDKLIAGPLLEYARRQKVDLTLQEWRKKLLHIEAVMNDAEEKQIRERAVKVWLDDLKALAYDIEDVLDELVTKANRLSLTEGPQPSSSKVRKFIPTFHPSRSVFNGKISKKIKKITEDLDTIANRKFGLHLREGVGGFSFSAEERLTTSLVDEFGVYGRDADREKIMELLLSDEVSADQKVGVIPIVGMGGVGKTTLAQIIYNDKRVEDHFDTRIWVCVSDQFDLVEITKAILESVTKDSSHSRNLQFLQDGLKKELNGKRFLLVLDDIWNENPNNWSVLQAPFRVGAHGSFVMVTTRNENVASIMRTTASYHLNELSDKYCWSLFAHLAFENITSDALQSLELIGKKIVKKCKGLPLAAKTIGGLLRSKQDENAWKEMLNNKIWDLPADQSSILPALHLSYHYLPTKLKQCFAYCSIFPKGYEFEKKQLILLWMGEGLVNGSRRGETVEKEGKLKHLRYLDLSYTAIHKLPESIGMLFNLQTLMLSNCNFLSEVPSEIGKLINLRYFDISKTKLEGMPMGINRLKDLQVLTTFVVGWKHAAARIKDLRDLSQLGGTLSILNLQNVVCAADALEANLKDKGKLDDLVFGWDCNAVSGDLQNQTRVLENLQPHKKLKTLTIEYYYGAKFPNWLGDPSFMNLVFLQLKSCKSCLSLPPIGQLQSLKGLSIVKIGVQRVGPEFCGNGSGSSSFKPFGSLKTLKFEEMLEWEEWTCSQVEFPCLEELYVQKCPKLKGDIPKHLPLLTKLEITECGQLVDSLPMVPSLCELKLTECNDVVFRSAVDITSLTSLIVNDICKIPLELQHLHSLVRLTIYGCPELREVPPILHKLNSLKQLVIKGCSSLQSLLEMGLPPMLQKLDIENAAFWSPWKMRIASLKYLDIKDCGKLDLPLPEEMMPSYYASLTTLIINSSCDSLTSFPLDGIHHVEFTSLNYMYINNCPNLVSFPQGGLSAPNLSVLILQQCKKLKSLPQGMHTLLTSLEILVLYDCQELVSFPDEGLPTNLSLLDITNCYKLMEHRMEWGLQRLPFLRKFSLRGCKEEISDPFPEMWLLPSTLTFLIIKDFPNLKSLAKEGFQHLTSLEGFTFPTVMNSSPFQKRGCQAPSLCLELRAVLC
ncbi:putative disease resistance protein RGA1 [Vitis vinifera]|uniref:Putative disease resistance protein RGA1 n=1 Tax=Vitis vinifera TaxID=29760 RepID=A0A438EN37_VITVI|nr:putative disease resistance protein RGA1 [Vitis vinifera]